MLNISMACAIGMFSNSNQRSSTLQRYLLHTVLVHVAAWIQTDLTGPHTSYINCSHPLQEALRKCNELKLTASSFYQHDRHEKNRIKTKWLVVWCCYRIWPEATVPIEGILHRCIFRMGVFVSVNLLFRFRNNSRHPFTKAR